MLAGIPDGRRIGLLGGSFDPPHGGHLTLSRAALTGLDLDEVWWLVSPQNPLKQKAASMERRLLQAGEVAAQERRITVCALERTLGTRYTIDTIEALRHRCPRLRFVWLMGADNLAQIHRWKLWQRIFQLVPVAVFARPAYSNTALANIAAHRFAGNRRLGRDIRSLADAKPPAWAYFFSRLDPLSSSRLRSHQTLESDRA